MRFSVSTASTGGGSTDISAPTRRDDDISDEARYAATVFCFNYCWEEGGDKVGVVGFAVQLAVDSEISGGIHAFADS
jgi:hypothetical protein